ncbi:MAG: tetratricopeptide repeat protein [Terracidiphilus sp.]
MRRVFWIAVVLAGGGWAVSQARAQTPANSDSPSSAQNQPAPKQTGSAKPAAKAPAESNPFPEDTSTVPVMPTASSPGAPIPLPDAADYGNVPVPGEDADPVHSPDDANTSSASSSDSSDSATGLDQLLKPPPETRKEKGKDADAVPVDGPKEDENVGSYYIETKNWKAALSRFDSALVLDPENPEVYWGLAEAQRNLGDYANAKANYLKVMEYDPDSKHAKEAKKILKQPEMVNAPAVSSNSAPAKTQ